MQIWFAFQKYVIIQTLATPVIVEDAQYVKNNKYKKE